MFLLIIYGSHGAAYSCPADFDVDQRKKVFHDWIGRFKGRFSLKGCQVEITVCDPKMARTEGSMIGEIFLVDRRGREAYLPLHLVSKGNPKIRTSLQAHPKTLYYLKYDYFYEEELGQTEGYQLDLRLEPGTGEIKDIDLGIYASHKKLKRPDGTKSRWYNCGSKAW